MRIRHASSIRERDLAERARTLRDSVDPLLPRLTPECPTDRFDRLRSSLEVVREFKDDESKLDRMSRWGDPMARAYAGLLKFHLDPTLPDLLSLPLPGGTVSFAPFGRSTPEAEIAIQHFEDPSRLLLGYVEWTRKGYHFFAGPDRLWCTGRDPTPPAEFLRAKLNDLPYHLSEDADVGAFECPHLKAGEPRPFIEVGWPGANRAFRVCRKCVRGERHLLAAITENTSVPDRDAEFPVRAEFNARCKGGEECVHHNLPPLSRGARRAYVMGKSSDAQFLSAYLDEVRPAIEGTRRPTFVAGGYCYGPDRAAFLDALHPSIVERRALEAALAQDEGLFEVDEPSASRALEKVWPTQAEAVVRSIVNDPREAERYLAGSRHTPGRVAELLKRAQRRSEEREVLDSLPQYQRLAREAAYVDHIAREYRTHGPNGAERALLQGLPHEGKERGLAFGMLLALGRSGAHSWQFSDSEKEFGRTLEETASELLKAPTDGYHDALDRLFHAAGVANWGDRAPSR